MHLGVNLGIPWGQRRTRGEQQEKGPEQKKTRVSCEECGGAMAASSLCNHTEITDGIVLPQNRGVHIGGGGPETYRMYFSWVLKLVAFLVDR